MRGTKQANEATAKKLARELGQFRENPRSHLPAMEFSGKLRWGRTDPVTKTLSELEKIIKKKDDLKWLSKRMMSKRGDDVAKAFAGSLHAAHDEQFTMVGQFKSGSFGSGSYVRRGDGKPGYLAGIQNYANLTLRMLPWEDHAKRGMHFFSWEGGFVCTGPNPNPPKDWLADVLKRSRFELEHNEIDGHQVWTTKGLDAEDLMNGAPSSTGHVAFRFHNGSVIGLGLDALGCVDDEQGPFAGRDGTRHFIAEIDVPRGVDQIEDVFLTVFALVVHLNGVALDGDAPLSLQIHVIQGLLLQLTVGNRPGRLEQTVGQGALSVVDVCDDAKVADVFHGCQVLGIPRQIGSFTAPDATAKVLRESCAPDFVIFTRPTCNVCACNVRSSLTQRSTDEFIHLSYSLHWRLLRSLLGVLSSPSDRTDRLHRIS